MSFRNSDGLTPIKEQLVECTCITTEIISDTGSLKLNVYIYQNEFGNDSILGRYPLVKVVNGRDRSSRWLGNAFQRLAT